MYWIAFKKKNDYTTNTLKLTFPDGLDVEVINLTGATALRFPLGEITSNENRVLNVSDLPSGLYLLKVSGKDYEIVNKIMR
mgnify:CR=1 FL=1